MLLLLLWLIFLSTHCRSSLPRTHVLFLQRLVCRYISFDPQGKLLILSFETMRLEDDLLFNDLCVFTFQLKRWERKECKPNSLPVLHKMHVKFGDTVKVISGRDKGKIGEVTKIFTHNSTIVIKDVNLKTKHMKSREEGEPGQIVKVSVSQMTCSLTETIFCSFLYRLWIDYCAKCIVFSR